MALSMMVPMRTLILPQTKAIHSIRLLSMGANNGTIVVMDLTMGVHVGVIDNSSMTIGL